MKQTKRPSQKKRALPNPKGSQQRVGMRSADKNGAPEPERSGRSGVGGEYLPSLPHARKMLLDYMDSKRPWANCKDVYVVMEEIANYASYAFRGELIPTKEQVAEMSRDLMRFTEALDSHPENYNGPCACSECRSYGD